MGPSHVVSLLVSETMGALTGDLFWIVEWWPESRRKSLFGTDTMGAGRWAAPDARMEGGRS